jgi:hypothetical protein
VEFNLQKWKKCLNKLRDMEKNDGFSLDHPIYIATMATAELYETSFNASLATAKRAQLATVAELASPSTATRASAGSTINSNDTSYNYDDEEDEDEDKE